MLNPPLFEWVLENLMKNALDAMEGTGEIQVTAFQRENYVNIDITDTGKGILKNNLEQIFCLLFCISVIQHFFGLILSCFPLLN